MRVDKDELRRLASAKLPRHMVPGRIVELDTLPLNINGKIDRKALEALSLGPEEGDR
jgi:acyl-coenzyme A synthetase/AMP-(fatty) acid ligase